ncbi:hypothetical protein [Pseudomonas sp. 008]|uniref:hypothetical protein n=1 Tax=unclassified Pseudomonas TaxID=196821 RepID=UPI00194E1D68|nr:hypothetical protein [Pseudomonas sp. 008]
MLEQLTIVLTPCARPYLEMKKWTSHHHLEMVGGFEKLQKTRSAEASLEASDDVITSLGFEQPKPSFFPSRSNFFRANDSAIGDSVRVVMRKVVEGHAKASVLDDHCIADKCRNGYCVFSETRVYKATHLEVTEIFGMKFNFDDFRHPAISK